MFACHRHSQHSSHSLRIADHLYPFIQFVPSLFFFFNQFHNPKDLNPIPIDFLDLYLLPSVGFHPGVLDDPDCRPQGCNCGFPSGSPRLFRSHATGSLQPEIAQQGLPNFRGRGYRICYDGSSSGTALRTSRSNAPRAMESPGGWKYRLYLLLEP